MDLSTNIFQIKRLIQFETGKPIHQHRLLFRGRLLNDTQTLESANISDGAALTLIIHVRKHFIGDMDNGTRRIFVKTQTGKTLSLDVVPSDTLDKVKSLIQLKEGTPYWQQCLRFQGRVLEDEGRSLLNYSIYNGALIHLLLYLDFEFEDESGEESSSVDENIQELSQSAIDFKPTPLEKWVLVGQPGEAPENLPEKHAVLEWTTS